MQIIGAIENKKLALITEDEAKTLDIINTLFWALYKRAPDRVYDEQTQQTPVTAVSAVVRRQPDDRGSVSAPVVPALSRRKSKSVQHPPKKARPPHTRPFGLPPQKWTPKPDPKRNKSCVICGTVFTDISRTNTRKVCDDPACKSELDRCSKHKRSVTGMEPEDFRAKRIAMIKAAAEKSDISITDNK